MLPQETLTHDTDDSTEFPRNWRFDEDGLELVGLYVRSDEGQTANGPCPILILEIDGEERTVWCFHTALRRRIADEVARRPSGDLKKGERVVIRQGEKKTTAEGGREYISYFTRFPDAPKRAARDIFKSDNIDAPPTTYDDEPARQSPGDGDDIPF
jgi:hypothetical protein